MARIFIDGFESGDHDMWDGEGNANVIPSGLMDGSYILDIASGNEYLYKSFTATDEMYFAVLWRPASGGADSILSFWNGTTILGKVIRDSGVLKIYGTSLLDTGTVDVSASEVVYLIEVYYKIADSGGRFVVKVDGVTDIDFTGDTKPNGDTQFNRARLGYAGLAGENTYAHFDNFVADDANWIGKTYIQALVPTGAGNTTGWTPSAGNNWECVDEKPPNDADYVSINSNDVVDTYATGDLAGTIGNVKCVQIQSRAEYDGTPTPKNLKLVVRSGGTDYLSGDKAVPLNAAGLWNLWENNPADSAAWEETDVNAMEIGVKSAA